MKGWRSYLREVRQGVAAVKRERPMNEALQTKPVPQEAVLTAVLRELVNVSNQLGTIAIGQPRRELFAAALLAGPLAARVPLSTWEPESRTMRRLCEIVWAVADELDSADPVRPASPAGPSQARPAPTDNDSALFTDADDEAALTVDEHTQPFSEE